jgi:hypothetical protein
MMVVNLVTVLKRVLLTCNIYLILYLANIWMLQTAVLFNHYHQTLMVMILYFLKCKSLVIAIQQIVSILHSKKDFNTRFIVFVLVVVEGKHFSKYLPLNELADTKAKEAHILPPVDFVYYHQDTPSTFQFSTIFIFS